MPADPHTKNDRRPTRQDVIVMREHTNYESPDTVSTDDTTAAFCAEEESE